MSQPPDRRSRRAVAWIAALSGMLAAALVVGPGQAFATHVGCGAVIVEDTTLDSDVTNCGRPAITIGADNVTIDLGGHTLDGIPYPPSIYTIGVDNRAGYDGVTIENGTIRDFNISVALDGANGSHLSRLTAPGVEVKNGSGNRLDHLEVPSVQLDEASDSLLNLSQVGYIGLSRSSHNRIEDNSVKGSFRVESSDANEIVGNSISASPGASWQGIGVTLDGSSDNRIADNEIFGYPGRALSSFRCDGSGGNQFEDNSIHDNGGIGMQISCSNDVVRHNTLARNDETAITAAGDGCVIEENTLSDNQGAIRLYGYGNRVTANMLTGNGFGMWLEHANGSILRKNVISHGGYSGSWGILVTSDSNGNQIDENLVSDIPGFGIVLGSGERNRAERNTVRDVGTALSLESARHSEVRRNSVSGDGTGMYIISADDNEIVANSFSGGLDGVYLGFSDRNLIAWNRIGGYERSGVLIIEQAHRDRIEHNTITRTGTGISITPRPGMDFGASQGIVLAGNTITRSGADGIFVQAENTETLLLDNFTNRNADDGIDVEDPTASLTRNAANRNSDLGIEAVPGVIDGGGNRARRNGTPLQCLNVGCS